MDSPSQNFEKLSFPGRDGYFNCIIIEALTHGMYSALVLVALWQTASMAYSRVRIIMLSVLVLMYLLATTHLGVRWYWVRQAFVVEATTPEDSFYVFLEVKYFWVWVVSGLTFGLNTVIADSVLIWRCWTIWSRDWRIVILPIVFTITGAVFNGFFLYQETLVTDDPNEEVSAWGSSINWGLPFLVMSLVTTLTCTSLIVYRIWLISKKKQGSKGFLKTYRGVIEILVQSAALYLLTLIIFLAFFVRDDLRSMYPLPILDSVTGIAPTLIVARVAAGETRPQSDEPVDNTPLQLDADHHIQLPPPDIVLPSFRFRSKDRSSVAV
ncbi:hypothetical protein CPB85DRAFT_1251651 [Mucidula mucida]|nr:hypothetical protein CPB85DRAFT_1251651 [Mucidula mucida]